MKLTLKKGKFSTFINKRKGNASVLSQQFSIRPIGAFEYWMLIFGV